MRDGPNDEHDRRITSERAREPAGTTEVGLAAWTSGTRELAWTVPEELSGLMFGCTVPGRFALMHSDIVLADET